MLENLEEEVPDSLGGLQVNSFLGSMGSPNIRPEGYHRGSRELLTDDTAL
jgi:hypothetical protein